MEQEKADHLSIPVEHRFRSATRPGAEEFASNNYPPLPPGVTRVPYFTPEQDEQIHAETVDAMKALAAVETDPEPVLLEPVIDLESIDDPEPVEEVKPVELAKTLKPLGGTPLKGK